eukprot:COSAG01_NODE_34222_length_551_cov_0.909292_1_plen_38_part_10
MGLSATSTKPCKMLLLLSDILRHPLAAPTCRTPLQHFP